MRHLTSLAIGPVGFRVGSDWRGPIAALYLVANAALGMHLFHGVWSLFQSMGWSSPRFDPVRRTFATAFTAVVVGGNLSFPIAVQLGVIS